MSDPIVPSNHDKPDGEKDRTQSIETGINGWQIIHSSSLIH